MGNTWVISRVFVTVIVLVDVIILVDVSDNEAIGVSADGGGYVRCWVCVDVDVCVDVILVTGLSQ
jgi:hypothetical protein